MFGTIRKHQTWLWVIIIAIMSISMVVFFSDGSLSRNAMDTGGDFGSIDGKPITRDQALDAYQEIRISEFLRNGKWPGGEADSARMLERQAANRVYLLYKVRQMEIDPSQRAVGLLVKEQIGEYPYNQLEKEILSKGGVTLADYERYAKHEAAIRQLFAAAGVTARLVNPHEAETLWKKENQEYDTKVAVFSASNFVGQVVITNGALETFYTNRQALYRLKERTILSYVAFAASNHLTDADQLLAKQTNLTDQINADYMRGGTNVWKDTNGVPMTEADAKAKIRENVRLYHARMAARRAASEFGTALINHPDANKLANLEALASTNKLTVHTSSPFDVESGPAEFANETSPVGPDDEEPVSFQQMLRQKAMTLTDDKPILFNPIPGHDAVYIIARKAKLPSENQSFETVKAKLTTDYKNFIAQTLARKAGLSFHTNLTNGLILKKSFDEVAKADNVLVIDPAPFSLSTSTLTNLDPRVDLRSLQRVVATLEAGQASSLVPQMNGDGWVVHLSSRPPIDDKKMAAGLDEFMGTIRQIRYGDSLNSWFMRQMDRDRFKPPATKDPAVSAAN